jgi:hypothetical protein
MVDVALSSYFLTHCSEHTLTNTDEVQEAIRSLKVGSGPKQFPEQGHEVKHLPQLAIYFFVQILTRFSAHITAQQYANTKGDLNPEIWKGSGTAFILAAR